MLESERSQLQSTREAEASRAAEQREASAVAERAHAEKQAALEAQCAQMETQMKSRAEATAKRILARVLNRTLADAFATLRQHHQQTKKMKLLVARCFRGVVANTFRRWVDHTAAAKAVINAAALSTRLRLVELYEQK